MWALLAELGKDRRGGVAVLFALASLPLMVTAGMAVDYARATNRQTKLQSAVDAAALAATRALSDTAANPEAVAQNQFWNAGSSFDTSRVSLSITVDRANGSVEVNAVESLLTSILPLIGINSMDYSARAVGKVSPNGPPVCILQLDATASTGMTASGGSKVVAPPCIMWANSTGGSAVKFSGGGSSITAGHCFQGGSSGTFSPAPENCGLRADPFASMNPASPSGCTFTNFSRGGGTYTLTPGVYCGGISLSGGPTVTLSPGVYVIRDGDLSMSGGGSMTGQNVAFLIEGASKVNLSGGGSYILSGRTSGDLAGFVFYQRPTSNVGGKATISGSGDMYFQGVLYFPSQQAVVSGGGSSQTTFSPFTAYIAQSFNYSGGSTLKIDYDPIRITVPVPSGIFRSTGSARLVN